MPCYHPIQAFQQESGEVIFVERQGQFRILSLPCGRCVGCLLDRSKQWAVRIGHESKCHATSSVITLTYSDEFLPDDGCLHYDDFVAFFKRLRERIRPTLIRFFVCGEYGDENLRPHFHAVIFGFDFPDRKLWKQAARSVQFRSPLLESCWKFGHSSVGELTNEAAAYIARYVVKKADRSTRLFSHFDPETGECSELTPEFVHMSTRPGIGANWYARFGGDVYHHDRCVHDGKAVKPPRFYDKLTKRWLGEAQLGEIKLDRALKAAPFRDDNSPERMVAKETVARARLKFYKRDL